MPFKNFNRFMHTPFFIIFFILIKNISNFEEKNSSVKMMAKNILIKKDTTSILLNSVRAFSINNQVD